MKAVELADRQRAFVGLLSCPLVTPWSNETLYLLVHRHFHTLRTWCARVDYRLMHVEQSYRLRRLPLSQTLFNTVTGANPSLGVTIPPQAETPTRGQLLLRLYAAACLDGQNRSSVTLQDLSNEVRNSAAARNGWPYNPESRWHRKMFIDAVAWLVTSGVLEERTSSEMLLNWENTGEGIGGGYLVHHDALMLLLDTEDITLALGRESGSGSSGSSGSFGAPLHEAPSEVAPAGASDLSGIHEETTANADKARNVATDTKDFLAEPVANLVDTPQNITAKTTVAPSSPATAPDALDFAETRDTRGVRLLRMLLEQQAIDIATLPEADREYLTGPQRSRLIAQAEEMTGGAVEVHSDLVVLSLHADLGVPESVLLQFPQSTTLDWVALAFIGILAANHGSTVIPREAVATHGKALYDQVRGQLTKKLKESPGVLTSQVGTRLEELGLVRRDKASWQLTGLAARYRDAQLVAEATHESGAGNETEALTLW